MNYVTPIESMLCRLARGRVKPVETKSEDCPEYLRGLTEPAILVGMPLERPGLRPMPLEYLGILPEGCNDLSTLESMEEINVGWFNHYSKKDEFPFFLERVSKDSVAECLDKYMEEPEKTREAAKVAAKRLYIHIRNSIDVEEKHLTFRYFSYLEQLCKLEYKVDVTEESEKVVLHYKEVQSAMECLPNRPSIWELSIKVNPAFVESYYTDGEFPEIDSYEMSYELSGKKRIYHFKDMSEMVYHLLNIAGQNEENQRRLLALQKYLDSLRKMTFLERLKWCFFKKS